MTQINPIQAILALARNAQLQSTKEALIIIHNLPKTEEAKELLKRLKVADQKIKSQLDFIEKLDRLI